MSHFGLFEAKNRFSELVARAQAGEDVVITKHRRPVARIVAYSDGESAQEAGRRQQASVARVAGLRDALAHRLSVTDIVAAMHPAIGS